MTAGVGGVVWREGAISVVINAGLSLVIFIALFGLRQPVAMPAFARDFVPQAFMVALMGSLVPPLLVRRRHGGASVRAVVGRALLIAVGGVAAAGGSAYALCLFTGVAVLPPVTAAAIKVGFGAMLAAIVTPIAVIAVLQTPGRLPS